MANELYRRIAKYLLGAETEKQEVARVTTELKPDLTVSEAYLIQQEIVNIKLSEGKKIIGPKMGLTSQAKMKQMNVDEPIYGYIFDYMLVENGGQVSFSEFIHPKVEAEIAFVMGKDVEGPGITGVQVLAATEYVLPALEIIDSRYEHFNFTLPDVIADNASSCRVVFGTTLKKPDQLALDLVGTTLSINGEIKDLGASAAVLGHPAHSVAMLANMLGKKGKKIHAGDVILSGGITSAIKFECGDFVSSKFDGLGEVTFSVMDW